MALLTSRAVRVAVARGSMAYSAVTQPPAAAAQKARHAVLHRCGAQHPRVADLDQRRAFGRHQIIRCDAYRTHLSRAPVARLLRPLLTSAARSGPIARSSSPDSRTNGGSPEVSSTAFRTQPPDLQPVLLMDMDFVVNCQLVQHRMPLIRFLYIGSYVCSTLLSDPASRRRPCASL